MIEQEPEVFTAFKDVVSKSQKALLQYTLYVQTDSPVLKPSRKEFDDNLRELKDSVESMVGICRKALEKEV